MSGAEHSFAVAWPELAVVVDGRRRIVAKGEQVPSGVDVRTLANLEAVGAIVLTSSAPSAPAATQAPNKSDNKDAWVAYAVARGMNDAEANKLTKVDLIEQFGGAPTSQPAGDSTTPPADPTGAPPVPPADPNVPPAPAAPPAGD